jgi:hypothetical protein
MTVFSAQVTVTSCYFDVLGSKLTNHEYKSAHRPNEQDSVTPRPSRVAEGDGVCRFRLRDRGALPGPRELWPMEPIDTLCSLGRGEHYRGLSSIHSQGFRSLPDAGPIFPSRVEHVDGGRVSPRLHQRCEERPGLCTRGGTEQDAYEFSATSGSANAASLNLSTVTCELSTKPEASTCNS